MISSSFKVLQVNLNRSGPATESALQIAVELKIDLLVVQEPWTAPRNQDPDYSNTRSILHPSFTQILPADLSLRPRTLVYVARSFRPTVALASSSPADPDLLVVDIIEGNQRVQLLNIYNEASPLGSGPWTLDRVVYHRTLLPGSILLGDFNTHHPWWDPLAKATSGADQLVKWIDTQDLALLNTPGTGTFFRPNLARESVLDLTLATSSLASRIQDWQVLPDLGSDHHGILFSVAGTLGPDLVKNPMQPARYNTALANWDLFAASLRSNIATSTILNSPEYLELATGKDLGFKLLNSQPLALTTLLDSAAQELTNAITLAARASIPASRPSTRAKPWWNPELKDLRKDMLQKQRALARNPGFKLPYLQAKNTYFLAIKQAKQDHWNQFLEREDPKSIFKAMAYTKDSQIEKIPPIQGQDTFQGKCKALRETLFPVPPSAPEPSWNSYRPRNWNWSSLTQSELADACSAKIKGKTPGPDQITQDIILQVYKAIPEVFFKLYSRLLDIGYHPRC